MQAQSTVSPVDLAWAAGFIDGEGCISISHMRALIRRIRRKHSGSKRAAQYVLRLEVSQVSTFPLRRLQACFGGTVNKERNRQPAKHKTTHRWVLQHQKAADCLKSILPYLCVKSKQATIALEFVATFQRRNPHGALTPSEIGRRAELKAAMNALNKRGP